MCLEASMSTDDFYNCMFTKHHLPHNINALASLARSPVNSPHKSQWRGALMLSFICAWINGWVNNGNIVDCCLFRGLVPDTYHDDVIKWKHFPRYWPFVRGIHRSPVNSPHKGQWRGGLIFSLICVWINGWVNNREAGDLRCYRAHYDVTVMQLRVTYAPGMPEKFSPQPTSTETAS